MNDRPEPISVYRDDGLLARGLGRTLGRVVPVPAPVLILTALLPLLAVAAFAGGDVSTGVVAGLVAWSVLVCGTSAGRPRRAAVAWTEPPLLRATEYATLIWIAAVEGADAYPAAFALIAALTFRHYDLVYRLRHRGVTPAGWVSGLAGGWDGRLIAATVLLAVGALPTAFFVAAAVLGVVFVAESVVGWVVFGRVQRPLVYEDEED
jgi:Family of unknown function (DUF5941)